MTEFENITGDKMFDLIDALIRDRTLLTVSIPESDYAKLTMIIGAKGKGASGKFEIDPPEGMATLLQQHPNAKVTFEFSNDLKLPHRFQTTVDSAGTEIWMAYPKAIRRYQLRNNFRIKAPDDAHCFATIQGRDIQMVIDNISLGGALCHCPNSSKSLIEMDQSIKDLVMKFSIGGKDLTLGVDGALIRRIESRARPKHFGLALEFVEIKPKSKKLLTQVVYELQRYYLQNRIKGR